MKAAWYERQGAAAEVLVVGTMPDPEPGPDEVRMRVAASGINPGDVKKRQDVFGYGMAYPRVIPHSDGAGLIDRVGAKVSPTRLGEHVWCYGAQSYRAHGTAAEYTVVPARQAVPLGEEIAFEQGACLGIPGITAHRAVHVAGDVKGKTVLVQGGGGAVGQCAIALARHAGARVIATVRSSRDETIARKAGAHEVVPARDAGSRIVEQISALASDGIDHVVEVALHANASIDEAVLRNGGSIATYASGEANPRIPFWPLVFKNVAIFFLGSDDFPAEVKQQAALDLNAALAAGWSGFAIGARYPLDKIAAAHQRVEDASQPGCTVLVI